MVPIVVDGVVAISARNELRLSHGAGPRAHKLRSIDAFFRLQDLQRRKQLRIAIAGAPALMRQRRQRTDHVAVADLFAVLAFHAPDGRQDARIHTVLLLQLFERGRAG